MRKCCKLLLCLLLFPAVTIAQFGFEYKDSIVVIEGSDTLLNPWAGGLNYPQFSDFDYDFDGDSDLFLFDRSTNNVRVYTQEGTVDKYYKFAYNSRQHFPVDLKYRVALVDFDNDGRKDLFTYTIGGLMVYRNVGDIVNGLQWELFQPVVNSIYPMGTSPLAISSSDIPAIADIDGDGDIDVLTFNMLGNRVEYHQNQSVDLYGIPDSLIFELKNECWGKFTEHDMNNSIVLNDPNAPCVGGSISDPEDYTPNENLTKKHVGSSILALDMNGSGVMDILLGDAAYSSLTLLTNGGVAVNTDSPMISVEYNFPSSSIPIKTTLFPAAYFIDVDFDGIKDLIAAPNALNVSFNESSIKFYKNIGTNSVPNFFPTSSNFLQSEMIEHGTGSIPVLFDYDEDGLDDLFVANFYRFKPVNDKESTIAYYRNIGTSTEPTYQYVDYNFLDLSNESYGLRTVPTFGDIDGDGDKDLFLGFADGTLAFYENLSIGSGAIWSSAILNYQDESGVIINSGDFNYPVLYDVNEDGLLDLSIGTKTGGIIYYENIGTPTSPSFQLSNSNLGNVDVTSNSPDGFAAPHYIKSNGKLHLFVGNIDGKLVYYDSIENNLSPGDNFNLLTTNYLGIDVGGFSSFLVNDVDSDGNFNMFVGQDLGGIFHFEADPLSNISLDAIDAHSLVSVYPNPANSSITISSPIPLIKYELKDLSGKLLISRQTSILKENLDVRSLPKGLYLLSIDLENGDRVIKKILKD